MAYTQVKRELRLQFRDIRGKTRSRTVEISTGNLVVSDDIENLHEVSKSAVRSFRLSRKEVDMELNADAGSEVHDTGRWYFLMEDDTIASFDIPDPKDELFMATEGADANTMIPYADLSILQGAQNSMKFLIDDILAGRILISDGETPIAYMNGVRI